MTHPNGFRSLFNRREEHARGRMVMLASAVISSIISNLSSGVFYTAFLRINGISITDMGIITYLPVIANCFCIFSPIILEHFPRRRWLLISARLLYFALSIVGITLIPSLTSGHGTRLFLISATLFLANLINALFSSGFTIWHLNFIPDTVRAEYLSYSQIASFTVSGAVLLGCGYLADVLAGSPCEETILVILRCAAFGFALLEAFFLARPKEYPYPKSAQKLRLSSIFTLPFQNRRFLVTMLAISLWTFVNGWTSSSLTYYLLDCGASYSLINIVNVSYSVFLILLAPLWRHLLHRWGWIKTFLITTALMIPSFGVYAFVSPLNYIWLYPTVRIYQHMVGVGQNLSFANLCYLNLPQENGTLFFSFYTLVSNLMTFLSAFVGAQFVLLTAGHTLSVFGVDLCGTQMLLLFQSIAVVFIVVALYLLRRPMTPLAGDRA